MDLQYAIMDGKRIVTYPSIGIGGVILHRLGDLWVIHVPNNKERHAGMLLVRARPVNSKAGTLTVLKESPTKDNYRAVEREMVEDAMLFSGRVSPWYIARCASVSKSSMSLVGDQLVRDSAKISEKLGVPFTVALEVVFSLIGAT